MAVFNENLQNSEVVVEKILSAYVRVRFFLYIESLNTLSQNSMNISIKSKPVTVGANATQVSGPENVQQKPDTVHTVQCTRCIRSSRDRLGFYAEIKILFGTVYTRT